MKAQTGSSRLMSITVEVVGVALLSLHACLNLPQLAFSSQQLLSLLVDLSLHLDFDFPELLFLTSELFFLEADGLVGEVFRVDGRILWAVAMLAYELGCGGATYFETPPSTLLLNFSVL